MNYTIHRRDDPRSLSSANLLADRFPQIKGTAPEDGEYFAWSERYGTTAGPFGGLGGAAISEFTLEAFVFWDTYAAVWCRDKLVGLTDRFAFLGCQWKGVKDGA